MVSQQQTSWGWKIALYLFFAGAGAGAFFFGFVLTYLGRFMVMAGLSTFAGALIVLVSTFFLLADLGAGAWDTSSMLNARRMYRLPSGTSWILRGTVILVLMVVFGLGYSIPVVFSGDMPPAGLGIVAAIFSILTILYTGFLLGSIKAIPFWNTPVLPMLFLFSGLSTGIAIMALISIAMLKGITLVSSLHLLGLIDIPLIVLELIALATYLETGWHGNDLMRESVCLLIRGMAAPLFWGILIVIGLIVPLILEITGLATVPFVAAINSVFLLLGGVYLRYLILKCGIQVLALPTSGRPLTIAGWTGLPG